MGFDPIEEQQAAQKAVKAIRKDGGVGYTKTTVIFPSTELKLVYNAPPGAYFSTLEDVPFYLTTGQKCKVVWNGVEYNCTCFSEETEDESTKMFFIGNAGLLNGINVTTEPFLIAFIIITYEEGNTDKVVQIITLDPTATMSISTETIHPIDPKYLPGVCLPVVNLGVMLEVSNPALPLSETVSAELDAVAEKMLPIVCIVNCVGYEVSAPMMYANNGTTPSYVTTSPLGELSLARIDSGWVVNFVAG